jgi:hypothetical protein
MSNIQQYFGFEVNYPNVMESQKLMVGMECEIESIAQYNTEVNSTWMITTDGSLRNHGLEFISKPATVEQAKTLFKNLHAGIQFKPINPPFSERTSIHVHANCANLTLDQTRNVILMYALFEEYFFRLVESQRRHNIHCVALTETYLPHYYSGNLQILVDRWHKYTALNIKPLKSQGTIEFRHMHGTQDQQLVNEWLGVINRLFDLKNIKMTQKNLDRVNMRQWFDQIFCESRVRLEGNYIEHFCYNSILDIKGSLV